MNALNSSKLFLASYYLSLLAYGEATVSAGHENKPLLYFSGFSFSNEVGVDERKAGGDIWSTKRFL